MCFNKFGLVDDQCLYTIQRWMVGADKSTVLWRPREFQVIYLVNFFRRECASDL